MIGWSPYDALQTFDPTQIETSLTAAGGRLLLNPFEKASSAARYASPAAPSGPAAIATGGPIYDVRQAAPSAGLFGLPTVAVAGIGVGLVAVLGLAAYAIKKKRKKKR